MSAIQYIVVSVAEHGPFLMVLLPVVGALLVMLSAPWGPQVVRRTALTNVCLSVGIALLILIQFQTASPVKDSSPSRFQMAGHATLEFGAHEEAADESVDIPSTEQKLKSALLQIAVGVDGVSLWFAVLIPVIMIPAVCDHSSTSGTAGHLVLLLLLESSLLGVFLATDVMFFGICLEGTAFLLFLLIGRFGSPEHRRELPSLAIMQCAGDLLILFGLTALALASWRMTGDGSLSLSHSEIAAAIPADSEEATPAGIFWKECGRIVFWLLMVGFWLRSGLFPFHGRMCEHHQPWPTSVGIVVQGLLPCLVTFGFLRWVLPFCPAIATWASETLIFVALGGAVFTGLLALRQTDLTRIVSYASVSHAGLAFAAAATLTPAGLSGSVIHLIGHIVGFTALTIAVTANHNRQPAWLTSVLIGVAAVAVVGIPLLSGFPAQWLTLIGFQRFGEETGSHLIPAVLAVLVTCLLLWVFLRIAIQLRNEAEILRDIEHDRTDESGQVGNVITPLAMSVVLMLAVGLGPQFVIKRLQPALRVIAPGSFDSESAAKEVSP